MGKRKGGEDNGMATRRVETCEEKGERRGDIVNIVQGRKITHLYSPANGYSQWARMEVRGKYQRIETEAEE
jgi:hypothetical protein